MTVEELTNIFLRLEMADKAKDSEFLFGSGEEGVDPFPITRVVLDEDGDVCLESDDRIEEGLSAAELAEAVSLGGDSDTLACITGGIAEAFYVGVPKVMAERVLGLLPEEFKAILSEMAEKTPNGKIFI